MFEYDKLTIVRLPNILDNDGTQMGGMYVLALSGNYHNIILFRDWFVRRAFMRDALPPNWIREVRDRPMGVAVRTDPLAPLVFCIDEHVLSPLPSTLKVGFGSGGDMATGSMMAGADAPAAVAIACQRNIDTGNGVDVVDCLTVAPKIVRVT